MGGAEGRGEGVHGAVEEHHDAEKEEEDACVY